MDRVLIKKDPYGEGLSIIHVYSILAVLQVAYPGKLVDFVSYSYTSRTFPYLLELRECHMQFA